MSKGFMVYVVRVWNPCAMEEWTDAVYDNEECAKNRVEEIEERYRFMIKEQDLGRDIEDEGSVLCSEYKGFYLKCQMF